MRVRFSKESARVPAAKISAGAVVFLFHGPKVLFCMSYIRSRMCLRSWLSHQKHSLIICHGPSCLSRLAYATNDVLDNATYQFVSFRMILLYVPKSGRSETRRCCGRPYLVCTAFSSCIELPREEPAASINLP
ncbi:hypothetical protein K469DRAFT_260271 [Zopfia rhizophila CBS 207.26]|uniref:Uncharacterized protein n=1 Tax=Zopfia rhizophila CBS 207.26 TaxID=1314779 RepID=A0A6A6DV62_9PEZI|nr:hypothetical protein K469DRAFT_260271 [Zopfia rhizophila CBS 207.26]